jgi:virginiamycin B lyase
MRYAKVFVFVLLWLPAGLHAEAPVSIRGKVTDKNGPLEGAYVGAHGAGKTFTTYVMTDSRGEFTFRGLAPGSYAAFTKIPSFHKVEKDAITVQPGKEARADFQVEPESDFMTLVDQASNSELLESLPLPKAAVNALDSRCSSRCHGASYYLKARFDAKGWMLVVSKMESITPVADMNPPIVRPNRNTGQEPPRRGSNTGTDKEIYSTSGEEGSIRDNAHIVEYLTKISGPDSTGFPIKFQPRAMGKFTRAVVVEYQVPRPGAYAHDVLLDPGGGYAWYNDWRANYVGSVNMKTGEIKEYPIPGREDRPGGFHSQRWDQYGNLWLGQLWSGRIVRFDVKSGKTTGGWAVPQAWARTGTVVVCQTLTHSDGPVWTQDALIGTQWTFNPETEKFTEVKNARWNVCDKEGNLYGFVRRGVLRKIEPGLKKTTDYITPTPNALANENRLNLDSDGNIWYGDWESRHIGMLDTHAEKILEFLIPTPWSLAYNAIGDGLHRVGWTVPHMSDRMVKADVKTGDVVEFPLPSRGYQIRNLDLEMSANPPAVWFINQRDGSIVRFQEYITP